MVDRRLRRDENLIAELEKFENPSFTGDLEEWKTVVAKRIRKAKYRDYSFGFLQWYLGVHTPKYFLRLDLISIGAGLILTDLAKGKYSEFELSRWDPLPPLEFEIATKSLLIPLEFEIATKSLLIPLEFEIATKSLLIPLEFEIATKSLLIPLEFETN
jgi:hypothetical protein